MHKFLHAAPFVLATLALFGCKGGNSLIGTWAAQVPSGRGAVTMTFNGDNTCEVDSNALGITEKQSGTYTTDGKSITMTISKLDIHAQDPKMQAMLDGIKQASSSKLNKADTSPIEWKNANQFAMGATGNPNVKITFDRKSQ